MLGHVSARLALREYAQREDRAAAQWKKQSAANEPRSAFPGVFPLLAALIGIDPLQSARQPAFTRTACPT
ncbi:hypothetical protein CUJ87_21695 [Paraburkholderia caledonica]|jgi:hypothetical protein|nr:hypothetical protein CUJ87_21695 [Paraburkholderia caledonica]